MAKDSEAKPLLPPAWGWQAYEEEMRELAAQRVIHFRERTRHTADWRRADLDRSVIWMHQQQNAGRLPDSPAQEEKGAAFEKVWKGLLEETEKDYAAGRLGRGKAHLPDMLRKGPLLVHNLKKHARAGISTTICR